MSSPKSIGNVDLESVFSVGRRTLASIGEASSALQQRYTDMVYLKREDHCNSLISIESKLVISGELQFLCGIFERYTSNASIQEGSNDSSSNRTSFSTTFEENEDLEEEEEQTGKSDSAPIVSKLRQTSISSQSSSSPPKVAESPIHRQKFHSTSHSQTTTSTTSDYSRQNLEGKRYGSLQIPTMTIIEVLEILFRAGLELVNQSSNYDKDNVLHQTFIFIQIRHTGQRLGHSSYPQTMSLIGT